MTDQNFQKVRANNTESDSNSAFFPAMSDSDEINILEYVYVLVKNKWWILGFAFLGLVSGYLVAIIKGPVFKAEAVIAAKENENKSAPNLSGLGAFGGLVASQLNIGGNPGLDKIDLILGSRKFNAELVEKYGLLPQVMKNLYPKVYKTWYDTLKNEWKEDFKKPNILAIGAAVSSSILKKELNNNNTMTIVVNSKDSTFADTLLIKCLQYLNIYIKDMVLREARENVSYLDKQLEIVADPLLREKLQGLIANEMEKEMLVSKEAFRVVDPPIRVIEYRIKKILPIIFFMAGGFIALLVVIVSHSISNCVKLPHDRYYLKMIKKNLLINKRD
jgi:LPS O-antigen subunit length determinant protein (WzzB/FepE family)